MLIGEVEQAAGKLHRQPLIAIQCEEPYSGNTILIMHVGAQVELEEPGKPGYGRAVGRAHIIHMEGHNAEIGFAVIGIDGEAWWQVLLDERRVHLPVQEEQVRPFLPHHYG